MIYKSINYAWILLIVFFKIRCHNAEVVNATSSPVTTVSPILSKFFDRGNPNFREPGRFGNSPNNYPGNPFLPYGNQNDPEGFGWDLQDPSQNYFPGRPYQRPGNYPGNQGDGPYNRGPNNFEPNYIAGMNPHYPRPPYPNRPGNMNGPYQTGGMPNQGGYPYRPIGMPHNMRYNPNGGRYPPQGSYQGNPNLPPRGSDPNSRPYYPNNLNNIPDSNIQFPGNNVPSNPNQYPDGNQGNVPIRPNQNNNYPSYPTNNNPSSYPSSNDNTVDSSIRFPNEDDTNAMPSNNNVPDISNLPSNGVPQNQISTNKQFVSSNDASTNDIAAIRGKPVFVSSATSSPGQTITGAS